MAIIILDKKKRCQFPSAKFLAFIASISNLKISEKLFNSNEKMMRITKNIMEIRNVFFQKIPVFTLSEKVIILIFHYYGVCRGLV